MLWESLVTMHPSTDTPPSKGLRRFTVIWVLLTLVSAPFSYGIFLILTVPVLSGLLAALFVGGRDANARARAPMFGVALVVSLVWFVLRADERPVEGAIAGLLVVLVAFVLVRLRRASRTPVPVG